MEWIRQLRGKIIGVDTAPIIYLIEDNPKYSHLLAPFFEALDRGEFKAVTSTITLIEVLVHPLKQQRKDLYQQYKNILSNTKGLALLPILETTAEKAAELRANFNLRTPDALQIACALNEHSSYFLTNDLRIPPIPGIEILYLDKLNTGQ